MGPARISSPTRLAAFARYAGLPSLLLGLASGCPQRESPPEPTPSQAARRADEYAAARAAVVQHTTQKFTTVALLRPSDQGIARRLVYLAPLIMQEPQAVTAPPEFAQFGAVRMTERELPAVDVQRPTVYFYPSRAAWRAGEHEQWTYVWFYPPANGTDPLRWRAFRMTLDAQGLPLVWESAADNTSLRVLYVSAALAAAAEQTHGPARPGRHYAIETPVPDWPHVVVARLLGDGPQPMGPYVYLDRELTVTTLLCRCTPAQAERWFTEGLYQLVQLRDLADLKLGDHVTPHLGLSSDPAWLEKVLRLPSEEASGSGSK